MKKFFKITGITVIILIVLAFLIPVVFKKQIQRLVKKEINKSINAKVDFSDVKLSLLKHFPKVTIVIKDLSIVGTNEFTADTLLSAKKVDASAGLFNVLKGKDIKLHGLYLNSPRIHALMNADGKANWDIAKSSSDNSPDNDTTASAFKMTLKHYEINNGYLLYKDERANTYTEFKDLDHSGSGDLTADVFTLSTRTKAGSVTLIQDDVPYLYDTETDIEADIKIDNKTNAYTFDTKDIKLNDLELSTAGFFQLVNDSTYNMDIKFESPSNDFKSILSMIPAMYTKDFADIKTSGKAIFNGFVKGTYSPQQVPAYDVNLDIKEGSFQYPDLPKPVKNIQLSIRASNKDGYPDNSVVDISHGHLEMNNEPFDFRFNYKYPKSTQLIDAGIKGKLDLSQLSNYIKLNNSTKLSGLVWADAFVRGSLKKFENGGDFIEAGGFFDIKNLFYSSADFPQPIKNGNIKATIENSGGIADNTVIKASSGHIEIGNDPLDFSLQLSKPMSVINFAGTAKGRFTLDNIRQFTTLEPGTSISGVLVTDMGFAGNKAAITQKQYDKITLSGNASLNNFNYKSADYPSGISINGTQLSFNPSNITLSNMSGKYLSTQFTASGTLNNFIGYLMDSQGLNGTLNVNTGTMNLNEWMGTVSNEKADDAIATASTSSETPFLVPPGVSFVVYANADKVQYDGVDYNNVKGTMQLEDEKITLKNITTNVLGGDVVLNGSYSTKIHKKEPDIGFTYDIRNMDVQKAFTSYNTIKALMPIGKFLSGTLNSQLTLTGNLKGNMMPKLNSLSGNGNLLLLKGVLQQFAPLEKLAAALQIDRLKTISVKEIKNYIEFANGRVLVKPFNLKIDNIDMEIGGFHGFDNSIDYAIQMKLPRSVMGTNGNNLVNNLADAANKKGIPIKLGETVNLHIKLTGSISNPSLKIDLKETAGDAIKELEEQAKDFVQAKIDSAKQKVKDSIQAVKNQVTDKVKDKLLEQVFGKDTTNQNNQQDTIPKKTDPIKKVIKNIFIKPKKPVEDSTNN